MSDRLLSVSGLPEAKCLISGVNDDHKKGKAGAETELNFLPVMMIK